MSNPGWSLADESLLVQGYIEAALWTAHDDLGCRDGDPCDLSQGAIESMRRTCEAFLTNNRDDINEALKYERYIDMSYIGHDFWLSGNGHGAGFLDRDLPDELAERLAAASSKGIGLSWLERGEDGKIYLV